MNRISRVVGNRNSIIGSTTDSESQLINIVKKLIWFKRHLVLRTLTKVPE